MSYKRFTALMILGAFVLFVLCAVPAQALPRTIRLSEYASDGNNPPTYDKLDATFNFSVVGTTLTLRVTNLTPELPSDPALKINEVYFNTSADVTALALNSAVHSTRGDIKSAWPLTFDKDNIIVNGFGLYDVSLIDGQGSEPNIINTGEYIDFTMTISGSGPFNSSDFIQLSTQTDDHIITAAAAKFYNGPPEMSAYGASVPEPATICLLGLGGLALLRKRR